MHFAFDDFGSRVNTVYHINYRRLFSPFIFYLKKAGSVLNFILMFILKTHTDGNCAFLTWTRGIFPYDGGNW